MSKIKAVTFADIENVIESQFSAIDVNEIKSLLVIDFVSLDLVKKIMQSYLRLSLGLLGNSDLVDKFMVEHKESLNSFEIELLSLIQGQSSRVVSKVLTAKLKSIFRKKSGDILDSISQTYQRAIKEGRQINFFKACNLIPTIEAGKIRYKISISKTIK